MAHTLVQTITDTVANGGTSSSGVELEAWDILGLDVPTLTSSTFKIQVQCNGTNWRDVYDSTGTQQLTWTASTGDRFLSAASLSHIIGAKKARIVCGSAQGAARTFTWVVKDSVV